MKEVRILIFIDWFYPAYKAGGPVKSVYNIIQSLSKDFAFMVVTSNVDVGGELLNVESNKIIDQPMFSVYYADSGKQTETNYLQLFNDFQPNLIYYNSVFSRNFTLKPFLLFKKQKVKQIIAPRGMLGEGALKIKSIKKRFFLMIAKLSFFRDNVIWHASTDLEKAEIENVFGKHSNIQVAQNITSSPVKRSIDVGFKQNGNLKLVFISRISEKKNLKYLLHLLAKLREVNGLELTIYGPIEDESYWASCKKIFQSDERIVYKGTLNPADISNELQNHHFFILPTLHENYGHAITESINAGVPIIISQNTPWRNLEKSNIGFDLSIAKTDNWLSVIRSLVNMDNSQYCKMSEACYEYSKRNIVSSTVIEQNKKLFGLAV